MDQPLPFGNSWTDNTYREWISLRSKKPSLILDNLSIPDQIFDLIDKSWDDSHLPTCSIGSADFDIKFESFQLILCDREIPQSVPIRSYIF